MRNMKKTISTVLLACLSTFYGCAHREKIDNTPVQNFSLQKYLGTWYEIGRLNHPFERHLSHVSAEYKMMPGGKVRVTNSGLKGNEYKKTVGKAFQPHPEKREGRLRVSFFGPFYSDYRVLTISPDYRYALIGSKSSGYLWIMSRTPAMPSDVLSDIVSDAESRGYDLDKLIWVEQ